jgi:toxin ParE1/3/4
MKLVALRIRRQAHEDIKSIYDWIVAQYGDIQAARRIADDIYTRCEGLVEFPFKGRSRDDLSKGMRVLPFEKKAIIAYRVVADTIEIMNVFYGGRDYETLIRDDQDF